MTPDVSVIVQTFERPHDLRQCLDALKLYMLGNVNAELVVADDGSRDAETHDIIRRSEATAVFVNDTDKRLGPGYTLNGAIAMARASFIIHVEDDFILVRDFTQEDLDACMEAFDATDDLALIRLRVLDGEPSSASRLREYREKSDGEYCFGGQSFARYTRADAGGTSYQYTGNAHIRSVLKFAGVGPYPEDCNIWRLENRMASAFRQSTLRCGSFRKGWFTHSPSESTKTQSGTFTK